jgi:hypothetical protein
MIGCRKKLKVLRRERLKETLNLYSNYRELHKEQKRNMDSLKNKLKLDMNIKSESAGPVRHQLIFATHLVLFKSMNY